MYVHGEKSRNGFKVSVDLLTKPMAWLLGGVALLAAIFVLAQSYLHPNHQTTVEVPGRGSIETRPIPDVLEKPRESSETEIVILDPEKLVIPPQPDTFDGHDLAPSFRNGVVPMPKRRPYGHFYVGIRAQGDGDGGYVYVPVPCDLARPVPRACFEHPDDRMKVPVYRKERRR